MSTANRGRDDSETRVECVGTNERSEGVELRTYYDQQLAALKSRGAATAPPTAGRTPRLAAAERYLEAIEEYDATMKRR